MVFGFRCPIRSGMTTGFIGHDIGFVGDDYSGMTIRGWLLVSSGMTTGFIGEDYSGMTVGFIGDDYWFHRA